MLAANDVLSDEETQVLDRAKELGQLSVELYRGGIFSEPEFVLYGVLERLVIRRRLAYLGMKGDQSNASYHYGLPENQEPAAPLRRNHLLQA